MTALGQKQTRRGQIVISALPPEADIGLQRTPRADCVRFVGAPRLDLVADGVGEAPSRQPRSETRALCCIEFKHY
jgi:hypothetical protein